MEMEVFSLNSSSLERPAKQSSQNFKTISFFEELCTKVNIITEILGWRPLFLKWGSTWAIKERWTVVDLSVVLLCSPITETEEGHLLL